MPRQQRSATLNDEYKAFKAYKDRDGRAAEEMQTLKRIVADISTDPRVLVFRNNVGVSRSADGAFIRFGLCVGSSDLIGSVTGDDGRATPFALEVKSSVGRPTEDQRRFIEAVRRAGWLAGVVRSVAEARAVLGL